MVKPGSPTALESNRAHILRFSECYRHTHNAVGLLDTMAAISGVAGFFFDTLGAILGQYYLHYGVSVLCVGGVEIGISRGTPPLLTTPPGAKIAPNATTWTRLGTKLDAIWVFSGPLLVRVGAILGNGE